MAGIIPITLLEKIATSRYGRDIRQSIHDSLEIASNNYSQINSMITGHTNNEDIHVTSVEKNMWGQIADPSAIYEDISRNLTSEEYDDMFKP